CWARIVVNEMESPRTKPSKTIRRVVFINDLQRARRSADEVAREAGRVEVCSRPVWQSRSRRNTIGNPMRRTSTSILVVALLILGLGIGYAQQIFSGYYGYTPPRWPTANTFKGAFNMCRVMFTSNRREKRGWDTDYPGADINFSVRLSELTRTRVTRQPNHTDPEHVVVRLTDQALFQCPFVLFEDAGTAIFNDQEVKQLREYFLRGGFAFVSDYWGPLAKEQFDDQIGRVLPHDKYPIIDLPMDHPIWHTQFEVKHPPKISSIQAWRRGPRPPGGKISVHRPADGSSDLAHAVRAEAPAADVVDTGVATGRRRNR